MKSTTCLWLGVALAGPLGVLSAAAPRALTEGEVQTDPRLQQIKAAAGDLVLDNLRARLVVKAGQQDRRGLCLLVPHGPGSPVGVTPLTGVSWDKIEVGAINAVGAIRLIHDDQSFAVKLTIETSETGSEFLVTTAITNNSERELQLPVVETVWLTQSAKGAGGASGVALTMASSGEQLQIRPIESTPLALFELPSNRWMIGYPEANRAAKKSARNMLRFVGRSNVLTPVTPDKHWDKGLHDKDQWRQVAPGQTETVQRQWSLTMGDRLASTSTAPVVASKVTTTPGGIPAPVPIQSTPTAQHRSAPPLPTPPRVAATPRRNPAPTNPPAVAQRSTKPTPPPAPPTGNRPVVSNAPAGTKRHAPPVVASPGNQRNDRPMTASSVPPAPKLSLPPAAPTETANAAKISQSIISIPNLPPPTE